MGFENPFKRKTRPAEEKMNTPEQRAMDKKDRIAGVATLGLIGALGADIAMQSELPNIENRPKEVVQQMQEGKVNDAIIVEDAKGQKVTMDMKQNIIHMPPPGNADPKTIDLHEEPVTMRPPQ